jgi:hypothetical protein
MTSQIRPPRLALWLVNLFAPAEEAESILGDLVEEYSQLASQSGAAVARRWYRRQAVNTIAYLSGNAFRAAPWSIAGVVFGGFLLQSFGNELPEKVIAAVADRHLAYCRTHFNAYMFWMTDGILIGRVMVSMWVGCMVALVAKGREMVATITLGLVFCTLIGAAVIWVAMHRQMDVAWMLWSCADPVAIVVGGAIVRTQRSAATTLRSDA